MTAIPVTDADREAAEQAIRSWHADVDDLKRKETWIAEAIARARAEEREACAVLCEALDSCETDLGWTHCPERYAAAIRARGEQGGE